MQTQNYKINLNLKQLNFRSVQIITWSTCHETKTIWYWPFDSCQMASSESLKVQAYFIKKKLSNFQTFKLLLLQTPVTLLNAVVGKDPVMLWWVNSKNKILPWCQISEFPLMILGVLWYSWLPHTKCLLLLSNVHYLYCQLQG